MIDHIYLPVSDLNRSSEFYKKVLEPLGIDMPYKFDRLLGFAINSDPGFLAGRMAKSPKTFTSAFTRQERGRSQGQLQSGDRRGSYFNQGNRAFGPNGDTADYFAANIGDQD